MSNGFVRMRTKEEMVKVFWEDLQDRQYKRLFYALYLEKMITHDEDGDFNWLRLLTKGIDTLKIEDFAETRRTVKAMAKYLAIEL